MMNQNRRSFLKKAACAVVSLPVINELMPDIAFAQEPKEVPADDPTAKALGYHSDATAVNTTAYPKRAGPEGQKQFCSNCMLLVTSGVTIPGKEGSFGKCSVLQNGLVNSKGWCNSWILKPGA